MFFALVVALCKLASGAPKLGRSTHQWTLLYSCLGSFDSSIRSCFGSFDSSMGISFVQ